MDFTTLSTTYVNNSQKYSNLYKMSYIKAHNFGNVSNLPVYNNDPLTYCMGSSPAQYFNHGTSLMSVGQNSPPCQAYLATRCAQKWDNNCEYLSNVQSAGSDVAPQISSSSNTMYLTPGDILLVNTAEKKYLMQMLGTNCQKRTEQFDPVAIGGSPFITTYVGECFPVYFVDYKTIDSDHVMNKLLSKPWIATKFFGQLKSSMMQMGLFHTLRNTRLGKFYGL